MFKQFISNFTDSQFYLITSLWIFLAFFVVVSVLLYKMNKKHIEYMSKIPLTDSDKTL